MKAEYKGMLYMAGCAVLWSIGGILIKLVPWNSMVIAGFRSLLAACVVIVFMRFKKLHVVFTRRTLAIALSLGLTFFCFMGANKLTTAANAIVIQYTSPVFLLIYQAVFHKQRFHAMDYLVVALTLGGIALFFFDQLDSGSLAGNCLAILAGICFACMFICNSGVTEQVRLSGLLQGHLYTAAIGIPMMFLFDTPISTTAVLAILALGIVQLGIPYVLFAIAARTCPPLTSSLISALEPLLSPVWVFLFAGERPGTWALVGGAIVIVSVTTWCMWDGKRKEKLSAQQPAQA